jgi:hypothetical protein
VSLSDEQIKEWAILDTYDWFSPQYDQPQCKSTVEKWFQTSGFRDVSVERKVGLFVARGVKG